MRRSVILLAATLAGLACDRTSGGAATRAPGPQEGSRATTSPGDAFVFAEGTGSTNDEALAAARDVLLATLLGDPSWAELTGLDLSSSQAETTFGTDADGRVRARIELTRVGAATALTAFEEAELRVAGPAAWRDVLYGFLRAHVAAQACDQRRRLFAATCDAGDTSEADDALAQLTTEVELSPPFPDGVPADPDGRLLRPASVYVLWRGLPIAGVPVVASGGDDLAEVRAVSDARGVAVVTPPSGSRWSRLEVRLDTTSLLGPQREAWPARAVTLEPRTIDPRRWTLCTSQDDTELAAVLGARLKELGAPAASSIAAEALREIVGAEGSARAKRIAALADASSGRVDLVLVATATSRFAGRMGSSKSWAEAKGRLEIHDAWTGRLIATIEETATASGLGEERAAAAAREKLATALADRMLASPELQFAAR